MSKNNNVIQLFFYSVICLSIGFLIYNSCKNKIVEGLDETATKTKVSDEKAAKTGAKTEAKTEEQDYNDFVNAIHGAATGPDSVHGQDFTWGLNASRKFSQSPLPHSLPWIKTNMDLSGNLNDALTLLQNQRELLRLMGLNELSSNWGSLSPIFMNFYKDKMFFLDDLEKYIEKMCMKNGTQCSGNSSENSNVKKIHKWWEGANSDVHDDETKFDHFFKKHS